MNEHWILNWIWIIITQGRLTARRSDTILQRPRTAGGQARPAVRGRCRWRCPLLQFVETLLETVRAGRCPCLYDWKGESVPNSDFDFRNLLLDHVFQIFFGRRGREKWVERQEELAEFEWGPGSFSSSKSWFPAKWGTRYFNFEPNWLTKTLISCPNPN